MVDFMTQVGNVGKVRTTREDVYAYFQERYPGETQRRSALARAIQPFTSGREGKPLSYENVRRRYEGKRGVLGSRLSPAGMAEYAALGRTLPRMQPERGYHVKGIVCIEFSPGCEERYWDRQVIGENADMLYRTGSLQGLVNVYMGGLFDDENPEYAVCDEMECKSRLKVTPLSVKGRRTLRNIDESR